MLRKDVLKKSGALSLAAAMVLGATPYTAFAIGGTADSTAENNPTSVVRDLADYDIHDAAKKGSIHIYKYDTTSAEKDGLIFNYSSSDKNPLTSVNDDPVTDESKLTPKSGEPIDIVSNGKKNEGAEDKLKDYAINGVEFTYLKVGDVKTLSDVNHDDTNGDIELIYGLDTDIMNILGLKPFDKTAHPSGDGVYAAHKEGDVNYFTSQQINDALKNAMNNPNTTTYASSVSEGHGSTTTTTGDGAGRMDGRKGLTAKDALFDYIKTKNGTAMPLTGKGEGAAKGETKAENLDLGLYLIVETKVPENVTDTVDPWFVQVPMTNLDENNNKPAGDYWFYDIFCYPKNQTGHPTLDKKVRNEYGQAGLNYDSAGTATPTTNKVLTGESYASTPGEGGKVVTNNDSNKNLNNGEWLTADDKNGDYTYGDTVTASEGDVLDYILVTKLPKVTDKSTYLTEYRFVDTLSKGLDYQNNAKIAIYDDKAAAEVNDTSKALEIWSSAGEGNDHDFSVAKAIKKTAEFPMNDVKGTQWSDPDATAVTITVTNKGLEKINKGYYGKSESDFYLVAYYTAKVNSDASTVLGDNGNPNDVSLIWARTSDASHNYKNTLEDEAIVYSYGIDLTKKFSDKADAEGNFDKVKFVLYNETEDYYVMAKKTSDGLYHVIGKEVDKAKATQFSPNNSDAKGKLVINGLEADTYALTEVQTDKGYSIGKDQITVVITPSSRQLTPSNVMHMTVAEDHDIEHPTADRAITLSDGNTAPAYFEEGTTDKDMMIIGDLTPATAQAGTGTNLKKADMCKYGEQSLGLQSINELKRTDAKDSANGDVKLSVLNEKGFNLPKTGGAGLYLVTILGVILAGLGVMSMNKKKTA